MKGKFFCNNQTVWMPKSNQRMSKIKIQQQEKRKWKTKKWWSPTQVTCFCNFTFAVVI